MKLQDICEAKYSAPAKRKLTGTLSLKSGVKPVLKLRSNFTIYVSCTGSSTTLPMRKERDEFCHVIGVDGNGIEIPELVQQEQRATVHTHEHGWILRGPNWILEPD